MPPSAEDPLVAQAFDAKKQIDLARAIEQLTPEEAQFFLHKLEAAFRKRKIQITGYLVAMVAWLAGMVMALIYFGANDGSTIWAFALPFAIVGVVLYVFGWWAERVGKSAPQGPPPAPRKPPPPAPSAPADDAPPGEP